MVRPIHRLIRTNEVRYAELLCTLGCAINVTGVELLLDYPRDQHGHPHFLPQTPQTKWIVGDSKILVASPVMRLPHQVLLRNKNSV